MLLITRCVPFTLATIPATHITMTSAPVLWTVDPSAEQFPALSLPQFTNNTVPTQQSSRGLPPSSEAMYFFSPPTDLSGNTPPNATTDPSSPIPPPSAVAQPADRMSMSLMTNQATTPQSILLPLLATSAASWDSGPYYGGLPPPCQSTPVTASLVGSVASTNSFLPSSTVLNSGAISLSPGATPLFYVLDAHSPPGAAPYCTLLTNTGGGNATVFNPSTFASPPFHQTTTAVEGNTAAAAGSCNTGGSSPPGPMGNDFATGSSKAVGAGGSATRRPPLDVAAWGYAVADQLNLMLPRTPVPPTAVMMPTMGLATYNTDVVSSSTRPCASTVCLLYGEGGGCPAGSRCPAFHVDPAYLHLSRSMQQPLCCAIHNCCYSQEMLSHGTVAELARQRYCIALDTPPFLTKSTGTNVETRVVEMSVLHLSLSTGLLMLPVKGNDRIISLNRRVCRLHLEGRCKWTKDCGYVHVCRTLLPLLSSPAVLQFLDAVRHETRDLLLLRITSSAEVRRYVCTSCVLPLLSQLIAMRAVEALSALVSGSVACTAMQVSALRACSPMFAHLDLAFMNIVLISPSIEKLLLL